MYVCKNVHVCLCEMFSNHRCQFLIVLWGCLPLCTINSIICTKPSQPASPWATVFPSGVSALDAACHGCPLTVGTGLARPRWDVLAFGHCPLQEGRDRWGGGIEGSSLPSRHETENWSLCPAGVPVQGWRRVNRWGWEAPRGHLCVPWVSGSIWSLCRADSLCDKPAFGKQYCPTVFDSCPALLI